MALISCACVWMNSNLIGLYVEVNCCIKRVFYLLSRVPVYIPPHESNYKSEINEARSVPIGIPTVC